MDQGQIRDTCDSSGDNRDSSTQLAALMLDVQRELGGIAKCRRNEHLNYRYADIGSILQALNPIMQRHRFFLSFSVSRVEDVDVGCTGVRFELTTELFNAENEMLQSSNIPLIGIEPGQIKSPNSPMQNLGSAITYARRYALINLFNLRTTDDDGEQGVDRGREQRSKLKGMEYVEGFGE